MLINARQLEKSTSVTADVCIVGGGPAGSVIATELADSGLNVAIIESGGETHSDDVQSLACGATSGDPTPPTDESRCRRLGGASHLWNNGMAGGTTAFRCGMLSPIDFEQRDWVPDSGWPISFEDLQPWVARAAEVCGFAHTLFDGDDWATEDNPVLRIDRKIARTSVWTYAPQKTFTEDYPDRIRHSDRIRAYLNADVLEIQVNEAGTAATGVIAETLGGNKLSVSARAVILAAGGIENARLLLLSRSRRTNGLGNERDHVGRYFMEHPVFYGGVFVPSSPDVLQRLNLYDLCTSGKVAVTGKLNLTEDVLRGERLLNSGMTFVPRHRWYQPEAAKAVRNCVAALRSGAGVPVGTWREMLKGWPYLAVAGCRKLTRNKYLFPFVAPGPSLLDFGWSKDCHLPQRWQVLDGFLVSEQAPHPDNRITLSNQRDALGREQVNLHWELRRKDLDSVVRTQDWYADAFRRSGLGQFIPKRTAEEPELLWPGLHHHAGTTRMSSRAEDGVVNKDCEVHDVENLYITGCSVFRTAGYINPTLAIVSLSLRLAHHVATIAGAARSGPESGAEIQA